MKMLVVYNTCGIRKDNTLQYVRSIKSILDQDFDDFHVVLSSCLNSQKCIEEISKIFGNKISYSIINQSLTVNITFNKTIQESIKAFGKFDSYCYVDSGVDFNASNMILKSLYATFQKSPWAMISIQTNTDTAFNELGMKYETSEAQVTGNDFEIPIGKACNSHAQLFSHELYEAFDSRLIPDVFAAYCTESTFSFLCAAVNKKWCIMKDYIVNHTKGLDGASLSTPHWSPVYRNPWNNLLFGRNALDFINDKEAKYTGLGYEECAQIMMHDPTAFDKEGFSLYPEQLKMLILKYFFLNKAELDYDKIQCHYIL